MVPIVVEAITAVAWEVVIIVVATVVTTEETEVDTISDQTKETRTHLPMHKLNQQVGHHYDALFC